MRDAIKSIAIFQGRCNPRKGMIGGLPHRANQRKGFGILKGCRSRDTVRSKRRIGRREKAG